MLLKHDALAAVADFELVLLPSSFLSLILVLAFPSCSSKCWVLYRLYFFRVSLFWLSPVV